MATRCEGAFEITAWSEEQDAAWEGGTLSRTHAEKRFTGGVQGTSVVDAVMLGLDDGPMAYVAIERLEVEVDGKSGVFHLMHSATMHGEEHASRIEVVPGSGSAGLTGILGGAQILPDHGFVLDYELRD